MAEKVTTMKLEVNLQCETCCKKVKNVLCQFPQIRDPVFDEKQNIVTIKVVCCSPEKIRDMLCCKGCGCIKSIEIVGPSRTCCTPCSEGSRDWPCFQACGAPSTCGELARVPCSCFGGCRGPPRCYVGYVYARPLYDRCDGGRPCFVSRCDHYFSEENPAGCTVM